MAKRPHMDEEGVKRVEQPSHSNETAKTMVSENKEDAMHHASQTDAHEHHTKQQTSPDRHAGTKKSASRSNSSSRGKDTTLPWKIVSGILAVLLIASILTGGFSSLVSHQRTGERSESATEQVLDGAYVLGSATAPVTIIEYSDFQCPFCGRFFTQTFPQLKKDYIDTGKVKLIYRHFPLSFHKNAMNAALAAECAGEQGKFYTYHDLLFENQGAWENLANPRDVFLGYARKLGLDEATFTACYETQKYKKKIQSELAEGQQKGVSGTPTFFINGQRLVGAQPFSAFKAVIDAALAGKTGSQTTDQEQQKPQFKPVNITLTPDDMVLGSATAPVTIIEFTDFQCPFCRRYYFDAWQTLKQYVKNGTVRFAVKNFPLGFHDMANVTAQALLCVAEQNRSAYWDAMDIVFSKQQELAPQSTARFTEDQLYEWLSSLPGITMSSVKTCVSSGTYADRIRRDYQLGMQKAVEFGNSQIGTPFFFIGNDKQGYVLLVGAYPAEAFEQLIAAYAAGKNPLEAQQ